MTTSNIWRYLLLKIAGIRIFLKFLYKWQTWLIDMMANKSQKRIILMSNQGSKQTGASKCVTVIVWD